MRRTLQQISCELGDKSYGSPPIYHGISGDPNVLASTDFGLGLIATLEEIGFELKPLKTSILTMFEGTILFLPAETLLNSPLVASTIANGRNLKFGNI